MTSLVSFLARCFDRCYAPHPWHSCRGSVAIPQPAVPIRFFVTPLQLGPTQHTWMKDTPQAQTIIKKTRRHPQQQYENSSSSSRRNIVGGNLKPVTNNEETLRFFLRCGRRPGVRPPPPRNFSETFAFSVLMAALTSLPVSISSPQPLQACAGFLRRTR